MKLTQLVTSLLSLLLVVSIHAGVLPEPEAGHKLASRNPQQLGNVQVFISPHENGGKKVRILGGFRMTGPLLEIFVNAGNRGAKMASSMYNQFYLHYLSDTVATVEDWWGLYKGSTGGELEANLGVQFISYGENDDAIVQHVRNYFLDNPTCSILYQSVSDAWNIGGSFEQAPPARIAGRGVSDKKDDFEKRQDEQCMSIDWVSLCRNDVTWDPDAPLYGMTCAAG